MSVHGTARFATDAEMAAAGFLRSAGDGRPLDGLLVGFQAVNRNILPVVYDGDMHQLIVADTGGGKFRTALAPMVLGSNFDGQTVVIVDPKGEMARTLGPALQLPYSPKPSVHVLDPWNEVGAGTSSLNFLAELTPENPSYIDDARSLGDAIIIPSGDRDSSHWDTTARNFLSALLLYIALDPIEEGRRNLMRLRELITLPWSNPAGHEGPAARQTMSALFEHLARQDMAEGTVRRAVTAMLGRSEKERSYIISTMERDTAWIDSPQMKAVLSGSGIDMKDAALGGGFYFIVIPPRYAMTHRSWLRLTVTAFSNAFKRYQLPAAKVRPAGRRHIIIDEFPNLGTMSFVMNDVAVARGYGIQYHFTVQDLSQLKALYGDRWETFIGNCFVRVFAINDNFSAEYISRMIGVSTAQGISEAINRGTGSDGLPTHGTSTTYSQVQRPLMTPDEVRRMGSEDQYLFFRGLPPMQTWRPDFRMMFPVENQLALRHILLTVGKPMPEAEREAVADWHFFRDRIVVPPRPSLWRRLKKLLGRDEPQPEHKKPAAERRPV